MGRVSVAGIGMRLLFLFFFSVYALGFSEWNSAPLHLFLATNCLKHLLRMFGVTCCCSDDGSRVGGGGGVCS